MGGVNSKGCPGGGYMCPGGWERYIMGPELALPPPPPGMGGPKCLKSAGGIKVAKRPFVSGFPGGLCGPLVGFEPIHLASDDKLGLEEIGTGLFTIEEGGGGGGGRGCDDC